MNKVEQIPMSKQNGMTLVLVGLALVGAVTLHAQEVGLRDKQQTLRDSLQSIENAQQGMSFNGSMISAYRGSEVSGNALNAASPVMEGEAFTRAELILTARPAKDSRATLKARIHQDWQRAYNEGPNPFNLYWWNYGGTSLGGKLRFDAGDMRVEYTPFTITTPTPEPLQESSILKRRKSEAMGLRNLDANNSGRLMQGLDAEYNSADLGFVDNILIRSTIARLRNQSKKSDQIFFDFGETERFLMGGQMGIQAFSTNLGVNYVQVFDRVKSSRNWAPGNPVLDLETLNYDNYNLLSFNMDYQRKIGNARIALDGEFALSKASTYADYSANDTVWTLRYETSYCPGCPTGVNDSASYPFYMAQTFAGRQKVKIASLEDQALRLSLGGGLGNVGGAFALDGKVTFLQVGEDFVSDLAQSPAFVGNKGILNTDSWLADPVLAAIPSSMSTLENYYHNQFRTEPLTQMNSMSRGSDLAEPHLLYNNMERHHFFRNGWNNIAYNRSELVAMRRTAGRHTSGAIVPGSMDDALSLILPLGTATPNRRGARIAVNTLALDQIIEFQARLDMLSEISATGSSATNFMGYGVGLALELGRLLPLGRDIRLQCAFESAEAKGEVAIFQETERTAMRIGAGLVAEIVGPLVLQAGFEMLDKVLYKDAQGSLEVAEMLWIAGLEYKITTGSALRLEYGILANEFTRQNDLALPANSYKLDRNLVTAEVEVQF